MVRALKLSITPESSWQKTAENPPRAALVILFSILPLMIAALAIEGYALTRYGVTFGELGTRSVSESRALKYEVFYGVASLAVIFMGASLLKSVGASFDVKASYGACLVLIAFGYTPILISRMLDAAPGLNTWICWAVGAAFSLRIFYHGVPRWLKPEQTKWFGLFIISTISVLVLSALVHFASVQILHGKFLQDLYEPEMQLPSPKQT